MNLEERIAKLIDPEAWSLLDQHREEHPDPDERPPSRFTIESRDAARRVISLIILSPIIVVSAIIPAITQRRTRQDHKQPDKDQS